MEKSIEKIWEEGFVEKENLTIPKVIDFYNKKSKHLVARMKQTMYANHKNTLLISLMMLITYVIIGRFLTGLIIFTICIISFLVGKKQLKSLEEIDFGNNAYQHLVNFNQWWVTITLKTSKKIKYLLPILILVIILLEIFNVFLESPDRFIQILHDSSSIYIGCAIVFLIIIFWIFSETFYKKILNSIYGKEINKLQELINEMELLRKK